MNIHAQIINFIKEPGKVYLSAISLIGVSTFFALNSFTVPTPSEWTLLYCFIGSILILNHLTFQIPPKGNNLSMDSAVYLACVFVYGLTMTLNVLLLSSVIYAIYKRKIAWWKHFVNFALYSMMIIGACYIFNLSGGLTGPLNIRNIYPYLISLGVYFSINVLMVGLFYLISIKGNLFTVLKGILIETIAGYVSTLLLSLVLSILLANHYIFGLFLFMCISALLSVAFKQLFKLYDEVSEKAMKDQRTGLFNHGYFEVVLEKELVNSKEKNQPFALALMDIDNFKKYNDAHGHLKGDRLLEFFGAILKRECKEFNYFAARYGGEEFAILMPNTVETDAYTFINQLRKKINHSYFEGVEALPHGCISFSAGIIGYKKGMYDKSQLIDKADQAMYYAKAQGKNLVHIFDNQSLIQKTIDIEKEIHEIEQQLKIFLSKDIYTFQHSKRVYRYATEFSEKIGLGDYEKKTLILGALFHDIGKLEIPRDILNKTGKLTNEEWEMVKKHVLWGKEIASTNDKFKELIPLIELHHERFDGKGYPLGLSGDEIPKLARILCIIDSFDAMTTERPYQKTKTFEEAIQEIRICSGRQFDPQFVEPFIEMIAHKINLNNEVAVNERAV
jgi:diguanylate cyclase (GGDEF)-like protein/putative nucleotidyltransferase with HDIG domain